MIEALRVQMKNIQSRIEKAQQLGSPYWPLNEADTERLVIEPVLQALGYDEFDFAKHQQGQGADFPDYIVLPSCDQRWILEAKQWDARLGVREQRQAVNYARNNNAQWAVLTNGRQWWIYHVSFGDLNEQRIQEVPDICDIDCAIRILKYLSPASMHQNELGRESRALKIRAAVLAELRRDSGRLLKSLRDLVAHELDMNVTTDDVADALRSLLLGEAEPSAPETLVAAPEHADSDGATSVDIVSDDGWIELPSLGQCTGRKPACIRRGDAVYELRAWNDLAVFVVESTNAISQAGLPIVIGRSKRHFLNLSPVHSDGKHMTAPREVRLSDGQTGYLETHYSAQALLSNLLHLLSTVGIDPQEFQVRLASAD